MRKRLFIIFVSSVIFMLIGIVSCSDCGPFADKYKLVDIDIELRNVTYDTEDKKWIVNESLVADSLNYDKLGIQLDFETEFFFSAITRPTSLGLISRAYACSPVKPTTDEVITDFKIFSQEPFDDNHAVDSSLVDLFDVVVASFSSSDKKISLEDYLSTNPKIPKGLILMLKSPPLEHKEFEFTIEYKQDGIDVDTVILKTEKVLLY